MGTQQVLLIVLGVIIVGVAVAVGIQIFSDQSFISNKNTLASDTQGFATLVIGWYKAPVSHGGMSVQTPTEEDFANAAGFLAWDLVDGVPTTTNENGSYELSVANEGGVDYLILTAKGKAVNKQQLHTKITMKIKLPECTLHSTVENE